MVLSHLDPGVIPLMTGYGGWSGGWWGGGEGIRLGNSLTDDSYPCVTVGIAPLAGFSGGVVRVDTGFLALLRVGIVLSPVEISSWCSIYPSVTLLIIRRNVNSRVLE